jgi:hypothetical protein
VEKEEQMKTARSDRNMGQEGIGFNRKNTSLREICKRKLLAMILTAVSDRDENCGGRSWHTATASIAVAVDKSAREWEEGKRGGCLLRLLLGRPCCFGV